MIFNVDIRKLFQQKIPTFLRRVEGVSLILDSVADTLKVVLDKLKANRADNLYRLSITPQICYLEKMLNDRYDKVLRQIYISDGMLMEEVYVYTEEEQQDIYIFTEEEKKDLYIFQQDEGSGYSGVSFIVNVPDTIQFNIAEMTALINIYKLASRTFAIKLF